MRGWRKKPRNTPDEVEIQIGELPDRDDQLRDKIRNYGDPTSFQNRGVTNSYDYTAPLRTGAATIRAT
jgi:hypothetical protein